MTPGRTHGRREIPTAVSARQDLVFPAAAVLLALHGLLVSALAVVSEDAPRWMAGLAAAMLLAYAGLLWARHRLAWAGGVACLGLIGATWLASGAWLAWLLSSVWASGPKAPLGHALRGVALTYAPAALIAGLVTTGVAVALWRARERLPGTGGDASSGPAAVVALASVALLAWFGYALLHPVLADGS